MMSPEQPADRQKAADEEVSRFKITSKEKYQGPYYDKNLGDNGIADFAGDITARVGPTAYTSWSKLGYVLSHEIESHVQQFALPRESG